MILPIIILSARDVFYFYKKDINMTRDELIKYYVEQIKEYDKLIEITDAEVVQTEEVIDQDAQPNT